MAIEDTFQHFDPVAYARKISDQKSYPTHKLKTQEIAKQRQHVSAGVSMGSGIFFAPLTMGVSLVGTAWGARRLYIAEKKLELITKELTKRNVPLHDTEAKDILLPLAIGVVTFGVGNELSNLAAEATCSTAAAAAAPHGMDAVAAVVQDPSAAIQGVENAVSTELHEVGNAITEGLQGADFAADVDSSFVTMAGPATDAAALVGFAAGMAAMSVLEVQIAKYATDKVTWRAVNKLERQKGAAYYAAELPPSCKRRRGMGGIIICKHCKDTFHRNEKSFYHCCDCDGDNYNCCESCANDRNGCHAPEAHVMVKVFPDGRVPSCTRTGSISGKHSFTILQCAHCQSKIGKQDYYHCCHCDGDGFDMCVGCFDNSKWCRDDSHTTISMLHESRPNILNGLYLGSRNAIYNGVEDTPQLAKQGNTRLMVAWNDSAFYGQLRTATSVNGIDWESPQAVTAAIAADNAHSSPGLAHDESTGVTYLAWASKRRQLHVAQSASPTLDSEAWSKKQCRKLPKNLKVRGGISLAFVKPYLIVAWQGRDWHMYVTSSTDGGANWSDEVRLEEAYLSSKPTLHVSSEGALVLGMTMRDHTVIKRICEDLSNLTFGPSERVAIPYAAHESAAAAFDGTGVEWWACRDKEKNLVATAVFDGNLRSEQWRYHTSKSGPSLCHFKDRVVIAWAGPSYKEKKLSVWVAAVETR